VVFETDEGLGCQRFDLRVDHDVADEPLLPGFCSYIDHADAGESLSLGGRVVVAEELVAAADC